MRIGRPATWPPRRALLAALVVMALVFVPTFGGALGIRAEASAVAAEVADLVQDPPECFGVQAALHDTSCPGSHTVADRRYLLLPGIWRVSDAEGGADCIAFDIGGNAESSCSFGVPDGIQALDIAIVGDSHAFVWAPALERITRTYGARVHVYTKGWCSVTADTDVHFAERSDSDKAACDSWRLSTIEEIAASEEIDLVVTSARADHYLTGRGTGVEDDGHGYAEAWQRWLDAGKAVIAIADAPTYPGSLSQCTDGVTAPDPCPGSVSTVAEPNPLSNAAAAITDTRFAYADYSALWCDSICHSVVGGLPVSRDGNHLTSFLVQSFGSDFLRAEFSRVLP